MTVKWRLLTKILLVTNLLIMACLPGKAQPLTLSFKSNGQLTSFPPCYGFERTQQIQVHHDPDNALLFKLRKQVFSELKKQSTLLQKNLKDQRYLDFYSRLWGNWLDNFKTQAGKWDIYLSTMAEDTVSPDPAFLFFPIPSRMEALRKGFGVTATEGSNPKKADLETPFSGDDWIPGANHPEFSFFFQQTDVFRQDRIVDYNTNRPPEFKDISPDKIEEWINELKAIQDDSAAIARRLADENYRIIDPSCDQAAIDAILDKTRQTQLYQLFSNVFFMKWLWFTGGVLRLNPLGFTTADRFLPRPSAKTLADIKLFNSLYAAKLDCDVCKLSADSLAKIIRDQQSGRQLFTEDSSRLVKNNQKMLNDFLVSKQRLNRFSYPVRKHEDDDPRDANAILVHEYDAATHYKKIHRMLEDISSNIPFVSGVPSKKSRLEAENNIPDDVAAAVAIHNIPKTSQVNVLVAEADFKDASIAQNIVDTTLSLATGLYGLLNPVAGTAASLVKAEATNPPAGSVLAIEAPVSTAPSALPYTSNKLGGQDTAQVSFKIKVGRDLLDASFMKRGGDIVDCDDLKAHIIKTVFLHQNLQCVGTLDNIARDWIASKPLPDICTFKNNRQYDTALKAFVEAVKAQIPDAITNTKKALAGQLADKSQLYSYLLQLSDLSGPALPPDQLEAQLASDTADYNTATKYLDPTRTPVTENYQVVNVKGGKNDTVAKGKVNIAPKHFIELGGGVAFTIRKPDLVSVSGSGSALAIARDNNFAQFVAGVHIYIPGLGIYNPDNRFIIHRGRGKTYRDQVGLSSWNRISLFLGVGIPDPLKNFYSGLSADLWPGIRLNAGLHWLYYTKYQIINNQVSEQHSSLDGGSFYLGLNIDPKSLVSFLNIFKK